MSRFFLALIFAVTLIDVAEARGGGGNTPCSGGKGGVSHCSNGKFVCNDGSISGSTRTCGGSVSTPPSPRASSTPSMPVERPAPVTRAIAPVQKERFNRHEIKTDADGSQYYIDEQGNRVQMFP